MDSVVIHSYYNPVYEYPELTTIKTFASTFTTVSALLTITDRLTRELIRTTGQAEIQCDPKGNEIESASTWYAVCHGCVHEQIAAT